MGLIEFHIHLVNSTYFHLISNIYYWHIQYIDWLWLYKWYKKCHILNIC